MSDEPTVTLTAREYAIFLQQTTLRDQFAMAALPALIQEKFISPEKIAPTAYEFADAMLEARKEKSDALGQQKT